MTEKPGAVDGAAQTFPAIGVKSWVKARMARPGMRHIVRAVDRFNDRLGTQFAGAITYFSFLAVVPILMVAFSVAGFVLSSQPQLLLDLRNGIAGQLPAGLSSTIGDVLNAAVNARVTVGIIGLVIALYSGVSWMGTSAPPSKRSGDPTSTPTRKPGRKAWAATTSKAWAIWPPWVWGCWRRCCSPRPAPGRKASH